MNKRNPKSKSQCQTNDYDFYTIPFPLRQLGRKKRYAYLYKELEKRHPCFSDDSCFDSKLRLEKKGLMADVVVMQKYTLADYKSNGRKICISERKGSCFFKNKGALKIYSFLFLAFFLIFLLTGFFLHPKKSEPQSLGTAVSEAILKEKIILPLEEIKNLLAGINKLEGRVDSFFWKADGFNQQTILSLEGIFPEELQPLFSQTAPADIKYSSLSFASAIPQMTIELNQRIRLPPAMETVKDKKDDRALVRNWLLKEGVEVLEESLAPPSLKFQLSSQKNEIFFLEKMLDFFIKEEMAFSSLLIKKENQNLYMELNFASYDYDPDRELLKALKENALIFFREKNMPVKKETLSSFDKSVKQEGNQEMSLIGKIIYPDGKSYEFYKNKEGKIRRLPDE